MQEQKVDYRKLLERDYPEELRPGGHVDWMMEHCQWLDAHPEEWKTEPTWLREAYRENPEEAVLKASYEFLRSFA